MSRMRAAWGVCALALGIVLALPNASTAQTKLLRFPDIHGDQVAFCYAGDIWVASTSGGTARRLTAHPGQELFPKFSPDGKWIAFTGQYDGDEQVYIIPTKGGQPTQLTFYPAVGPLAPRWGYDNQVYGWTVDGSAVLFRTLRDGWDLTESRLYTVPIKGGLPVALPMPVSGAGDYSPDGTKVIYTPLVRDFRSWKRYQGGWAEDLYIFDLKTYETTRVTNNPRTDRDPMWIGNTIYFDSDRDGTLNLYAYDVPSKKLTELTHYDTFDLRWPSFGPEGKIVYELGGELRIYDTKTGKDTGISIFVPDDGVAMRPSHESAANLIENANLSPEGERVVFSARGDIFTVPREKGPTRNLTNTSGAHDKWPAWSPDGKRIVFISDKSGEEELYLVNEDGSGDLEQLTDNGHEMRYSPRWSPDGEHIAFSDKNGDLWSLEVKSKKITHVAHDKSGNMGDYQWSPNGGWLSFSLQDDNTFRSLYVWNLKDQKVHRITGVDFNEFEPVWDPKGDYLYYLSDRMYYPQIGSYEWNYVVDRETYIYALPLRKDVKNPFPPESDEVKVGEKSKKEEGKKEEKKEKSKEPIGIDFDGLAERAVRVPVDADNYNNLNAVEGYLIYQRTGPFYYGRRSDIKPEIQIFSMKDRKASKLADGRGYWLSRDGKKILVSNHGKYEMYDVKPKAGEPKTVSTSNMYVDRVPKEEWRQIFNEVWRRFRDFYYASNMHGYDWKAIGDRYRALLPYVAHRADLNYIIGEMIGELSTSHSYIVGGDFDIPKRPDVALPGARFALDAASGRYKISRIFEGQNEEPNYRSPLTEVGIDVKQGDYVLAIDGTQLTGNMNPYELLRFKSNRPVSFTVNSSPTMKGSHTVTYEPIKSEHDLIYLNWVLGNMRKVDKATNGRVGYIHIPDMGSDGIREFIKWFYPQIRKEGLVVDVRGNGGGNVSQMLIERLSRELLSVDYSRNSEYPHPYPNTVFVGHLVCLLNETSASDGDIFPAMFKQAGLGPLIGKRSWGGVIGITGHGQLIDGGQVFVPEYGFVSKEGKWAIENRGVEPDIVVDNPPKDVIEGRDPQLQRGIEEVMKAIKDHPMHIPSRPAKGPVHN